VGDGSTTFNVPDLRGRFPLGQDDMGGSDANRVISAQADTIGGVGGHHSGGGSVVPGSYLYLEPCVKYINDSNMPPYLTLNYIIKT
jgi:microcystin-dependent protein